MSHIESWRCDRCGMDIAGEPALTIRDSKRGGIDLCSTCYVDLREWVEKP